MESRESRIIKGLLTLLDAEGLTDERQILEADFGARNWRDLSQQDVDRVYAALQRATSPASTEPYSAQQPDKTADPVESSASVLKPVEPPHALAQVVTKPHPITKPASAAIADFTPFIESIAGGFAIAAALEELAAATTLDESQEALEGIFVRALGFAQDALDETERYQSETLRHVRVIARDAGFDVTLVALDYPYPYPNILAPVFKNHPYGLVVVVSPRWNTCRFVFRQIKGSRVGELWARTFVGRRPAPEPLDNLAIWTRRLEMLRPVYGESRGEKQLRVQRALATPAPAMAEDWSSAAVPLDVAPPGIGWGTLISRRLETFLQPVAPMSGRRSFTGLERALRSYFPASVAHGAAWLRYESYTVDQEQGSADQAFAEGRTWGWRVVLHFSLTRDLCQPGRQIDIPAVVPSATSNGRLVLNGSWYRFGPRMGNSPLIEELPVISREDDADENIFELLMPPDPFNEAKEPPPEDEPLVLAADAKVEPPKPEDEEEQDEESAMAFSGMDPCALLELATFRKLSAVRYHLWNASGLGFSLQNGPARENLSEDELVGAVRWSFRASWGRESRFLVVSKKYLAAILDRAPDTSSPHEHLMVVREPERGRVVTPPAWACPDVSVDLPTGYWHPVAAARLSPAGRLTVPVLRREGPVLSPLANSASNVNPRLGGDGPGPRRWWIAESLAFFAELKPGSLHAAAHIAAFAKPFPAMHLFSAPSETTESVVRISPNQLALFHGNEGPHLAVDIPCVDAREYCPVLRVRVGERVRPGEVWLTAPADPWRRASLAAEATIPPKEPPPLLQFARKGYPQVPLTLDIADDLVRWRIPPGISGKVVDARLSAVHDRSGGLRMSWRAFLRIAAEGTGTAGGYVILPDGRAVPIVSMDPLEAPFDETGAVAEAVIQEPWPTHENSGQVGSWRSGETGEPIRVIQREQLPVLYLPSSGCMLVESPDSWLRVRARDGEGIPAHARAPALPVWQRMWWAARAPRDDFAAAERDRAGGRPPFLHHLEEVLEAAMVDPLDEPEPSAPETQALDRLPNVLRDGAMGYRGAFDSGRAWHCECGDIHGARRAFERCERCLALVTLHPRKRRRLPVLTLPDLVLHPWRVELAAALLGTSVEDLLSFHASRGGAALAAALLELSQQDKVALARQRLLASGKKGGMSLGWLALLQDTSSGPSLVSRLLTRTLPVLPPILHPTSARSANSRTAHLPPLVSSHVSSPLTSRYFRVLHQSRRLEQLRRSNSQFLIEVSRRELQRAVSELFGPVEAGRSSAEPAHLAALLCRIWPLSRPTGLRSALPDMVRSWARPARASARSIVVERLSPDDKSLQPPAELQCKKPDPVVNPIREIEFFGVERMSLALAPEKPGSAHLGVMSRAQWRWMPSLPQRQAEPASPEFWRERFAMDVFVKDLLPFFVVIVAGRPPHETGNRCPRSEAQRDLSQLLAALSNPAAAPADLVQLFQAKLPMNLPRDGDEARQNVARIIHRAFPGNSPLLETARERLTLILASFWVVPVSPEHPLGWDWVAFESPSPTHGRRMVPPLQSMAWRLLPDFNAVAAPARFFLSNPERRWDLLPAAIRACLGFGTVLPGIQPEESHDEPLPPGVEETRDEAPAPHMPVPVAEAVTTRSLPVEPLTSIEQADVQLLSTSWVNWFGVTEADGLNKGSGA
ncbi:hypothetical protein [Myxococcus sp. AB036A]|uniref:hypothetical protein n=1 Tax=Myxococcus sp. AB036A TaxID=2562793 RepID=UPI001146F1FD|nr:hypothetical protein [Myxococcus sp. AB036A]